MEREPYRRPRRHWEEETGWAYALTGPSTSDILEKEPAAPLHRVFAPPEDVAEMAGRMVRGWHRPSGEDHGEWVQAPTAREAIEVYRRRIYGWCSDHMRSPAWATVRW